MGWRTGRLHFLHAYNPNLDVLTNDRGLGTHVFSYTVHYAGGATAEIPIHWKEEVANRYDRGTLLDDLRPPADATLAFVREVPDDLRDVRVR